MMKIQPRLILAACFVNFGFVPAEPENQIENQVITSKVHDDREIRKNFQNLFDSISKKDAEKIEIYRYVLKEELFNERQAFDEMKTELRLARSKNTKNKRNFYTNSNDNSNILVAKRKAIGNGRTSLNGVNANEKSANGFNCSCRCHTERDHLYKLLQKMVDEKNRKAKKKKLTFNEVVEQADTWLLHMAKSKISVVKAKLEDAKRKYNKEVFDKVNNSAGDVAGEIERTYEKVCNRLDQLNNATTESNDENRGPEEFVRYRSKTTPKNKSYRQ